MSRKNSEPRFHPQKFKLGDVVVATDRIWRADGKSELQRGEFAVISRVEQTTPSSPQIVGLEISGELPIHDLVCFEDLPIKLVTRQTQTGRTDGLMKEKQPKPKSVDECWMVERDWFNGTMEPCYPIPANHVAETRRRHKKTNDKTQRIRKWRAETVCEWRKVRTVTLCHSKHDVLESGCGRMHGINFLNYKFCHYCGGKIRVRKN